MAVTKIPKKIVTQIEQQKSMVVDREKYQQKRVAAYCRVSTDNEEQLNSYENQKRAYTEMIAAKKEWRLAGIFADEGLSGTRADKRPQFQKMIEACEAGKIDYIITKSVSRFARNTVDCLDHVRKLKAIGVGGYFEEQNIDTLKTDSELYLVIYAGFAQSESESISKNVTWGFRKNFEDGKAIFIYKKLLGYRKGTDGNPEIVPEEAAVVERIFRMYLSGMSALDISKCIRSEQITFPGKELSFSRNMILNMLRNEKYCGDCILQKTVTVDCIAKVRKKNEGEAPMYIVENNHPPIISREMFNRTQEELSRRNAMKPKSTKAAITATGRYSKYALTEVLQCGQCGSQYRRVTWNIRGKKRIVWRCVNRLDYGKKYCHDAPTLDENALHQAIVRVLNRFRQEDAQTYLTLMKATIGEAIGLQGNTDEIELLEKRIEALNDRMLTMVTELVSNGKDVDTQEVSFQQISQEIGQLQRRIDAIRETAEKDDSYRKKLQEIQNAIEHHEASSRVYDDSIVRQMIECIKVYPDKRLEVFFGGGYVMEEYVQG